MRSSMVGQYVFIDNPLLVATPEMFANHFTEIVYPKLQHWSTGTLEIFSFKQHTVMIDKYGIPNTVSIDNITYEQTVHTRLDTTQAINRKSNKAELSKACGLNKNSRKQQLLHNATPVEPVCQPTRRTKRQHGIDAYAFVKIIQNTGKEKSSNASSAGLDTVHFE